MCGFRAMLCFALLLMMTKGLEREARAYTAGAARGVRLSSLSSSPAPVGPGRSRGGQRGPGAKRVVVLRQSARPRGTCAAQGRETGSGPGFAVGGDSQLPYRRVVGTVSGPTPQPAPRTCCVNSGSAARWGPGQVGPTLPLDGGCGAANIRTRDPGSDLYRFNRTSNWAFIPVDRTSGVLLRG
jgi:hypothetical protein